MLEFTKKELEAISMIIGAEIGKNLNFIKSLENTQGFEELIKETEELKKIDLKIEKELLNK